MGSIEAYETASGRRYRVRYRDPAHQSREKAGFRRKVDAEEYLASVTVSSARGEYIDPRAAKVTIAELGPEWLANRTHLKASSWKSLEVAWRVHVEPAWGSRAIGDIRYSEVQAWIRRLAPPGQASRAATKVKRAHGVLAGILDSAVRDRRIASNPARGVMLPRKSPKARAYLSVEQVELLVELLPEHAALVYTLAYTGMRWGEVTGLRVRNLDLQRRRARVEENAVKVSNEIVVGTPKTHEARTVPLPRFLLQGLAQEIAGKGRDQLVFGDGDIHLQRPHARNGWFMRAVAAARALDPTFPRVTIHDLRHTAASLAVSAGANVKAVQRMLGHASAAMTLDTYADLFDDDLDAVSDRLDEVRTLRVSTSPHRSVGFLWGLEKDKGPRSASLRGSRALGSAEDGGFELPRVNTQRHASTYREAAFWRASGLARRSQRQRGALKYLAGSTRFSTRKGHSGWNAH
ncbi:tyrosine-type recombinase/integrase [Amnibacterium kyonggiense]|uniref:Site-specific recombinase XerD n=1 Tax=Amnibacterium kyonggiense TaxID=595671 RepID=A0A4R7FP49_9MICO|nr:site-specific integrase [Amnibacterium kyonggiense]TDS79510.1 site-specific recombinase XerD [Amnibacterium kyonggiense]